MLSCSKLWQIVGALVGSHEAFFVYLLVAVYLTLFLEVGVVVAAGDDTGFVVV